MQNHEAIQRERARALRKSRWWQTLITKSPCYYCHRPLTPREVTMDHIVPVAQGGKSTPGNVVPACKSCNTLKQDLTAVEWTLRLEAAKANAASTGG
jgi:5-methylcytosine-specific restriction endonuclease McrA